MRSFSKILPMSPTTRKYLYLAAARRERAECIKFVRSLNHLVADALAEKRGLM